MSAELMPRATVETMVAQRDSALEQYRAAHAAIEQAGAMLVQANRYTHEVFAQGSSGLRSRYGWQDATDPETFMFSPVPLPTNAEREPFTRAVVDRWAWSHLIKMTQLDRLMDKEAKDQFRSQLEREPPELTTENVYATLEHFAPEADTIFKRGIAKAFSSLDRRFRSHDGWKIGSRVILAHAFNKHGHWSHYGNLKDTLFDIERTFCILDNVKAPETYAGIVEKIDEDRRGQAFGKRQSLSQNEYFRVRVFENGNAHIWFERPDLVRKVNLLLAEYYGEALADDNDEGDTAGLHTPKTGIAKRCGFFPTPDALADRVVEDSALYRHPDRETLTVLEPSAGTGQLARRAVDAGAIVDCIEYQPQLAADLRSTGIYRMVLQGDFLEAVPDPAHLYDRVIMNPPFDGERDIDHVMHALKFLKPGGILIAIMSAGTEFRETRKSRAFRSLMQAKKATWRDLPAGSFISSGTAVNTVLLRVTNDGRCLK